MAQKKIDGVIECVRYTPAGQLETARAYLRRGATYSDSILLTRDSLVESLNKGKQFAIGKRIATLSSTFEIGQGVRLEKSGDIEYILTGQATSFRDDLSPAPSF